MSKIKMTAALGLGFLLTALPLLAQTPAVNIGIKGMDYPGPGYHYTVKTAWTDTRPFLWGSTGASKSAIGFVFKETPGAWYFPYNHTLPQEVAQANAVYSTLLSSIATGAEVNIHLFATQDGHYFFDQAQIGPAY